MMDDQRSAIFNRVCKILEDGYLGRNDPKVTEDTELLRDVQLTGDDVDEFFFEIARNFKIDPSEFGSLEIGKRFPGNELFSNPGRYRPMPVREVVDFVLAKCADKGGRS